MALKWLFKDDDTGWTEAREREKQRPERGKMWAEKRDMRAKLMGGCGDG